MKPDKGLTCLNFNIRSLPKNYQFINEFDCLSLDVVGFAETWLTCEQDSMYLLDGCRQFFVSRIINKDGGISFHVKHSLISNEVVSFRKCNLSIKCIFVEVNIKFDKITIGNIYRPLKGNFNDFIETFTFILHKLSWSFMNCKLILMEDFN